MKGRLFLLLFRSVQHLFIYRFFLALSLHFLPPFEERTGGKARENLEGEDRRRGRRERNRFSFGKRCCTAPAEKKPLSRKSHFLLSGFGGGAVAKKIPEGKKEYSTRWKRGGGTEAERHPAVAALERGSLCLASFLLLCFLFSPMMEAAKQIAHLAGGGGRADAGRDIVARDGEEKAEGRKEETPLLFSSFARSPFPPPCAQEGKRRACEAMGGGAFILLLPLAPMPRLPPPPPFRACVPLPSSPPRGIYGQPAS